MVKRKTCVKLQATREKFDNENRSFKCSVKENFSTMQYKFLLVG